MAHDNSYYVPSAARWPIVGSISLFLFFIGFANWLHGSKTLGPTLFFVGLALLVVMLFGWFGKVIKENRTGKLSDHRVDASFRWGMVWFIFTEVMFFGTFFGVLFYIRVIVLPWLGGAGHGEATHLLLWPNFHGNWPVYQTPDPNSFTGPRDIMQAWGLPAINTTVLLLSSVSITIAHWGVFKDSRKQMIIFQAITFLLGILFLGLQCLEYWDAWFNKALTMSSGIYGSIFYMMTGFHALHVTVGVIMIGVILWRLIKGDFNSKDHFGFEAVSWYWHFVDAVWLLLFVFVYWL